MPAGKSPIHGRSHWLGGADPIAGLKLLELDIETVEGPIGDPTFQTELCLGDTDTGNATISVDIPDVTAGAIVIAFVGCGGTTGVTVVPSDVTIPTGWTTLTGMATGTGSGLYCTVAYRKFAVDTAGHTVVFDFDGGDVFMRFTSLTVLGGGFIGEFQSSVGSTSLYFWAPSVTSETEDALLVCGWASNNQRAFVDGGDWLWQFPFTDPAGDLLTEMCSFLMGGFTPAGGGSDDAPPVMTARLELPTPGVIDHVRAHHDSGLGGVQNPFAWSLVVEAG